MQLMTYTVSSCCNNKDAIIVCLGVCIERCLTKTSSSKRHGNDMGAIILARLDSLQDATSGPRS